MSEREGPLREHIVPDTVPLFAPLRAGFVDLLRGLEPVDWDLPTVAGDWRVRDVAAHLLDGELRKLAAHRDGHVLAPGVVITGYADVLSLIQRLNSEGVASGRHLSSRLLVDLLAVTGSWLDEFHATLDPDAPALYGVSWAGEATSTNRFDTAREYTERWHHEMQIRSALGARGNPSHLLGTRFGLPLLDTAMRVLPHAYRELAAAEHTTIVIAAEMSPDARWTLRREGAAWLLYSGGATNPACTVAGSADAWWRLFFNALPRSEASRSFAVTGTKALSEPLWDSRAVMV